MQPSCNLPAQVYILSAEARCSRLASVDDDALRAGRRLLAAAVPPRLDVWNEDSRRRRRRPRREPATVPRTRSSRASSSSRRRRWTLSTYFMGGVETTRPPRPSRRATPWRSTTWTTPRARPRFQAITYSLDKPQWAQCSQALIDDGRGAAVPHGRLPAAVHQRRAPLRHDGGEHARAVDGDRPARGQAHRPRLLLLCARGGAARRARATASSSSSRRRASPRTAATSPTASTSSRSSTTTTTRCQAVQAVPQAVGRLLLRGHGLLPVRVPRRARGGRRVRGHARRALRAPHAARRVPHALAHGPRAMWRTMDALPPSRPPPPPVPPVPPQPVAPPDPPPSSHDVPRRTAVSRLATPTPWPSRSRAGSRARRAARSRTTTTTPPPGTSRPRAAARCSRCPRPTTPGSRPGPRPPSTDRPPGRWWSGRVRARRSSVSFSECQGSCSCTLKIHALNDQRHVPKTATLTRLRGKGEGGTGSVTPKHHRERMARLRCAARAHCAPTKGPSQLSRPLIQLVKCLCVVPLGCILRLPSAPS